MADQQPQLPSWWDYAAKNLPPDIPDTAYDAQRQAFFDQNITPHVLGQGGNLEGVWQTFKHLTERPDKNPFPRTSHFATTAVKSALDPILGLVPGGRRAQEDFEKMTEDTRTELERQGMSATLPQMAGESVGMAPYFVPGMEAVKGAEAAVGGGRVGAALLEGLAGGVTQGAYDAAKAKDGHRIEDGLMGGAQGGAMFTALGLAHGLLKAHPDMPKSMAKDVVQNAKTVVPEPKVAAAEMAENAFPGVPQTVADTTAEQVKAADRNGIPIEHPQVEKSDGRIRLKIQGADGKIYNVGGGSGVNVAETKAFNIVINRVTQHLEAGGKILKESGDLNALQSLHKALERVNGLRGEYDVPVTLKGAGPSPSEPTLLQTPSDLLPEPPQAGTPSPAAVPLEGVEGPDSRPGGTPPSKEEPLAGERIDMLSGILQDPNAARVMKLHAKQELFRISPESLARIEAGLPLQSLEVPQGWSPQQWKEMLQLEAKEDAPELASRGLTLDDVPEYDKLEQQIDGRVQDLTTKKFYPNKEAALREKGLLRYSVGDPSKSSSTLGGDLTKVLKRIHPDETSESFVNRVGSTTLHDLRNAISDASADDYSEFTEASKHWIMGELESRYPGIKRFWDDAHVLPQESDRFENMTISQLARQPGGLDASVSRMEAAQEGMNAEYTEVTNSPDFVDFSRSESRDTDFFELNQKEDAAKRIAEKIKGAGKDKEPFDLSKFEGPKMSIGSPVEDSSKPSGTDIIRGSTEVPLSAKGEDQVYELGQQYADRGGVDSVVSSPKGRAIQTAQAIQQLNPSAQFEPPTRDLQPWMLGHMEGRAVGEVLPEMNDYIVNRPDEAVPGMGPQSTEPGESFNSFKDRTLQRVQAEMDAFHDNPDQRRVLVTHYRNIKAIQAWLKNGMPDDLSIDTDEMLRKDSSPGAVYHLRPDSNGKWQMDLADMSEQNQLDPGLYIQRHGTTSWNAENQSSPESVLKERPSGIAAVGAEPPTMFSQEGSLPPQAFGATFPTAPGEKPIYWFKQPTKAEVTHEWTHGMMRYFDLADSYRTRFEMDPMSDDFYKVFSKNEDLASVYKSPEVPEETYAYLAQAVRAGQDDLINHFAEADTDRESVLNWVTDRTREFQEALASEPPSVMKRVSQSRLSAIAKRATGELDGMGRDNIQIHGGDVNYDPKVGEYQVYHPDGSVSHFQDKNSMSDYLESLYSEPLTSRELVDSSALPDGIPRMGLGTKPFSSSKAPTGTNPPPPWHKWPGPKYLGKPEGGEIKPSMDIIGGWFRPFYNWINGVADRNKWPELSTVAGGVKDAEVKMQNELGEFVQPVKDLLTNFSHSRQRDVYKYFEADSTAERLDAIKRAQFTSTEIGHLNDFEENFINKAKDRLGVDVRDYMQRWAPKWRQLGDDLDSLRPRYSDTIRSPFQFMADSIRMGELDPRDENMARVSAAYLNAGMRKKFLEDPLRSFAELNNLKTKDGRYVTGGLQPLIKRHIEYMRGVPDYTEQIINNVIHQFKGLYNNGVEIANQHLPEKFQLNPIEDPPRVVLGKWILYQYAGGLALRPMVPIRDALQLFITTLPVLGEKYMWRGMETLFGKEGVMRLGTDSDAYQTALQSGALLRKNDLYKAISGEDAAKLGKWAEGAMSVIQHSHNSNRLVAFWGHFEKAADAAADNGENVQGFSKQAGLHWLDTNTRNKFLDEYSQKGFSDDLGHRIAKEMVDISQWNYSRGAQPGIHKYALGRLFGQYGIYPLNYIEFARKLATSGELSDKALALTRLTLAHGAILKAGESVGVDTAPWVFSQPMAYGGGPLFQSVTHIPGSMDFETQKGSDARAAVIRPIWPMGMPGGLEAYEVYKSIASDDPDAWKRILGFQPLAARDEDKGWHSLI